MATATYETVLEAARTLPPADQQRLLEALYAELEDLEDLGDGAAMLRRIAAGEEDVMTLEQATAALEAEWAERERTAPDA